jgi:hypothetical protein
VKSGIFGEWLQPSNNALGNPCSFIFDRLRESLAEGNLFLRTRERGSVPPRAQFRITLQEHMDHLVLNEVDLQGKLYEPFERFEQLGKLVGAGLKQFLNQLLVVLKGGAKADWQHRPKLHRTPYHFLMRFEVTPERAPFALRLLFLQVTNECSHVLESDQAQPAWGLPHTGAPKAFTGRPVYDAVKVDSQRLILLIEQSTRVGRESAFLVGVAAATTRPNSCPRSPVSVISREWHIGS